jgi:hypothetical protein
MNRGAIRKTAILLALASSAFSIPIARAAHADILFIDLNNSPLEIAKAQEAAKVRGEKLVVIPTQEWVNATTPPRFLNAKDLSDLIHSALKEGHVFDSLVLSGEHEVDNFFGTNGKMSKVEFGQILTSTPALTSTLRSVYGWGCYDDTLEMARWFWPLIPHLEMVAGVDGQGDKHNEPAGLTYLFGALTQEKKITQASDEKKSKNEIERLIRAIPGFNQNNSVVYTQNACYSKNYGDIDSASIAQSCSEQVHESLVDSAHDFFPMIYAPAKAEAVPCQTNNSWLRSYYDSLRDHDHCALIPGPNETSFIGVTSSEEQVIRMIYFQQVVTHFVRANQLDLEKLSALAAKHQPGFPTLDLSAGASCGTEPGNSRLNIINWISQLEAAESSLSGDDQAFLKSIQSKMKTQLLLLQCVPSGWVDPIDPRLPEVQSSCSSSEAIKR